MSHERRGPPPPPPSSDVVHTLAHVIHGLTKASYAPYKNEDVSDKIQLSGKAVLRRLNTILKPARHASIEARFDKATKNPAVYMEISVVIGAKIHDWLDDRKGGWFHAVDVYLLVVDALQARQHDTGSTDASTVIEIPSEELLLRIKVAASKALQMGISQFYKLAENLPTRRLAEKGNWWFKSEKLQAVLLHGMECTVWEEGRIVHGRLLFMSFKCFCVLVDTKPHMFNFSDDEVLSRKSGIRRKDLAAMKADSKTTEDGFEEV